MGDYTYELGLKNQYSDLIKEHNQYEISANKTANICYQILKEIPKEEKQAPKESFSEVSLIKAFNVDNFICSLGALPFQEKNMKINEKIDELQTIIDELRDIQKNTIDQEIQYQHFIKNYGIPFYSCGIGDCSIYQNIFDDRIGKLTDKKNHIEQRVHQLGSQIHFLKEAQKKI